MKTFTPRSARFAPPPIKRTRWPPPTPTRRTARAEARLLELADTQLTAKLPKDAAATYEAIWNEKLLPEKSEETLQRLVTAYHLAGDIPTSEARIATFKQQFPNSNAAAGWYCSAERRMRSRRPKRLPSRTAGRGEDRVRRRRDHVRRGGDEVPRVRPREPRPLRRGACATSRSRTGKRRSRRWRRSRRRSATATCRPRRTCSRTR